jgi:glutathione peroxidase
MKKYIVMTVITMAMMVSATGQKGFYDFTVKDISGKDFPLSSLKGKKVLVVNTASECGFTPQFEGLERLYREYSSDDFIIIGFPTNDFAKQDPGTNEEIAAFCQSKFDVTFPMMGKITVKGEDKHPLYKWLTIKSLNGVEKSKVAWNFQKYMISEEGELLGHVASMKKPYSDKIIDWLSE